MKNTYNTLWVVMALFSFILSGCSSGGAGEKEIRFVDPLNENRYYIIKDDTFTFHYLDNEEQTGKGLRYVDEGTEVTISGTVLKSDDGNTISFVEESGDTIEYFSDENFLGSKIVNVSQDKVYNDGKYFKFDTGALSGPYAQNEYKSQDIEMDTSGTYSISGLAETGIEIPGEWTDTEEEMVRISAGLRDKWSNWEEEGTYTVDGNIITLTGTAVYATITPAFDTIGTLTGKTGETKDIWYYYDNAIYKCYYLKED